MNQSVIIALDFPDSQKVFSFLENFHDEPLFVKVGMELYYQEGPTIVSQLKEMGHQVFLDIKLHDIPNTVFRAMKGLAKLGADLVNVHAAGGSVMMERALEGLDAGTPMGNKRPACIAVTQLTSTTEKQMQREQQILSTMEQSVTHYALLAKSAGLDGVVSSVKEVRSLRNYLGEEFLIVTPGIRLPEDELGDQNRVAGPQIARTEGASSIVVGRSITTSVNPYDAYLKIKKLWGE